MAAGRKREENLVERGLLADDATLHFATQPLQRVAQRRRIGASGACAGSDG
jgi:hypothetical protein